MIELILAASYHGHWSSPFVELTARPAVLLSVEHSSSPLDTNKSRSPKNTKTIKVRIEQATSPVKFTCWTDSQTSSSSTPLSSPVSECTATTLGRLASITGLENFSDPECLGCWKEILLLVDKFQEKVTLYQKPTIFPATNIQYPVCGSDRLHCSIETGLPQISSSLAFSQVRQTTCWTLKPGSSIQPNLLPAESPE